eukprot:snap_masked-scaffold_1-processed-gene-15.24-mRNA-1 protein AED:1.00 eAED:1.00 QI:0/0/0/0/1/1/2/0/82
MNKAIMIIYNLIQRPFQLRFSQDAPTFETTMHRFNSLCSFVAKKILLRWVLVTFEQGFSKSYECRWWSECFAQDSIFACPEI